MAETVNPVRNLTGDISRGVWDGKASALSALVHVGVRRGVAEGVQRGVQLVVEAAVQREALKVEVNLKREE